MYAILQWDKKYCEVCRMEVASGGFEVEGKRFCSQMHAEQYQKERQHEAATQNREMFGWSQKHCEVCGLEIRDRSCGICGKYFCSREHAEQYEKAMQGREGAAKVEARRRSQGRDGCGG